MASNGIAWTDEHLQILRREYPERGTNIRELPHSKAAIKTRAAELGIRYRNRHTEWNAQEVELLRRWYPEFGYKIPGLNRRTEHAIAMKAMVLGIRRIRPAAN